MKISIKWLTDRIDTRIETHCHDEIRNYQKEENYVDTHNAVCWILKKIALEQRILASNNQLDGTSDNNAK